MHFISCFSSLIFPLTSKRFLLPQNVYLPVYEYKPAGLLRGLNELIVLALRCNPVDADEVDGIWSIDLDGFLKHCRGDVGQDAEELIGAKRDFVDALLDFLRNIPGLVSVLHNPNFH